MGEQKIKLMDELREIRFHKTGIISDSERLERMRSIAEKTTGTMQDGSRGTATQDHMADTVAKAVDLADKLRTRIVEHEAMIQAVEHEVDLLPPNFRDVIRYRDFEGLTWRKVAERMNYEERQCRRIYQTMKERIRFVYIKTCP